MPAKDVVYESGGHLFVDRTDHNEKTVTRHLGKATFITEVFKVFETDEIYLELEFDYLGEKQKVIIPRAELKKSELIKYAAKGLNVNDSNAYYVIESITKQEENGDPPITIHQGIGWDIKVSDSGKTKDVFKGYNALGMKSTYNGKLPIKPKGKIEDLQEFVKEHVNGSPLSLAFAIGLSAVVVGLLGDILQCENLVVHFSGDSSIGKTTAARLAISVGSLPSFHVKHSLLNDYDGTENALLATLAGNKGYPTCFDEANMNNSKDFSRFIYRLASGREKKRLTRDATQKETESYLTTIISTGEKKLTKDSNQNTGKEIRVLQFSDIPWTNSAEHAETVNTFIVQENYGWGILHLAKYMLKIGKKAVLEKYESNRKVFIDKSLVKDTFTSRMSIRYAFILTAIELANECMKLELPYDYILDLLLKNEAETVDSRDIAQKAYDYLLEQTNVNIDKFTLADAGVDEVPVYRDVWGTRVPQKQPNIYDGKKCTLIIYFAKEKFRELLTKGNFEEPSVIIKKFKQKQWLDHDSDRDTRHRKIIKSGTAIDVYGVRIFEEPEEGQNEDTKPNTKRKPAKKTKSELYKDAEKEPLSAIFEDDD